MGDHDGTTRRVNVDIAVIGAGPVGLFAAYYAGFRGRSVAVVDALPVVGGQVSAMYPEKTILDVAGFPAVSGRELISGLELQVAPFGPEYVLGERAQTLEQSAGGSGAPGTVRIGTDKGTSIVAAAVVIACGVGSFTPRPLPAGSGVGVEDIDHFVGDPERYRGREAVVVGGGDSALDWALTLEPVASSVTVVHRRSTFRAHEHSVRAARECGIPLLTDAQIVGARYSSDSGIRSLQAVSIRHGSGEEVEIPCRRVVAALGFTAALGPLLSWGLEIEHNRQIVVDSRMRTTVSGVFAAGDITSYSGKVPLIAVGFGEAATAVSNACRLIDPDEPLYGGHSTDRSPVAAPQGVAG